VVEFAVEMFFIGIQPLRGWSNALSISPGLASLIFNSPGVIHTRLTGGQV
jgi:hypothetical protein